MTSDSAQSLPFETIGIVGCGLIGCSIAAGLKYRGFPGRIIGCGRSGPNLEMAADRGYVDVVETDFSQVGRLCDLVVVCTPVDHIVDDVRTAARNCRPGLLITDTGSVKRAICEPLSRDLPAGATYIGSHPIAGSEKQGCSHANPDLFFGHVCVLTPAESTPAYEIARLDAFWQSLGMKVVRMSPEAHDRALAQTSHVPHVVAAALAASLDPEIRHLTAGGFLDTTRIAVGDPELWAAILGANAGEVSMGIRTLCSRLATFLDVLEKGDRTALTHLLRIAKQDREAAAALAPGRHQHRTGAP
jgi:cyclohexadieny/prephenate dehydrogenase